ncbi:uncharacterized protein C19orf84 homolog isoform X2 [Emydura macquarii macquarii]
MPVLPSYPTPVSATPWILGRPSAGALSSTMVPIRLDALSFLLNSALLGAYSAFPPAPLSSGHGALAMGHGGATQHALGCRCQPHYCCNPQPACADPQQAQVGCHGSGAVGQSSAGCSREAPRGRAKWQDSSPRWDRRGSPSPRGWGENRRARGQKDFSRPLRGQRPWGEADSAPWKAGLWGPGPGRAQESDYAARKWNQEGRPWDAPAVKRRSGGWPQRQGSGAGETEAAKAPEEDWEVDYEGSTTRGSSAEEAKTSQPDLPASQGGEDWEKEYEESREPPKLAPGDPPLPEVALKVQPASLQERRTPRPPSQDSVFSSCLQNLFSDLPVVSELRREQQPSGDATESGTRPPGGGGGPHGWVSAEPRRGDLLSSAAKYKPRA